MAGSVDFKSFKYNDPMPNRRFKISKDGGEFIPASPKPANRMIRPTGWTDVTKVWYEVYDGQVLHATETFSAPEGAGPLTTVVTGPEA